MTPLSAEEERRHLESTPSSEGLRRLADALGERRVTRSTRLGGGLDAATHLLEVGGQRLVLKRYKPGATNADIEFDNLRHARAASVPTPAPIALDAEGEWFGTPALVMTALPGGHNLHPDDEDRWIRELAHALAAIHDTTVDGFVRRRPPRWERWAPWVELPDARMLAIADAMTVLRARATAETLVFSHDDFHPGNAVFIGDQLTGVVDWAYAELEPRQSGVAYCRKDLALHPGGDTPDRFLAAYEAEVGYRLDDMALWDVLQGSRALEHGHRWVPSFAELRIPITAEDIWDASVTFTDAALTQVPPQP